MKVELTDAQWTKISRLLPEPKAKLRAGRPRANDWDVMEGVLWVLRSGARWRDMSDRYPAYATYWRRLGEWERADLWLSLWRAFPKDLEEAQQLDCGEAFMDRTFAPACSGSAVTGGAMFKLMRVISVILLSALLAQPAIAQFGAASRVSSDHSWWLGAEGGNVRAVSLTDRPSAATWQLQEFSPYRVSLDYGRRERTIGVSASQTVVNMSYTGAACAQCAAEVTVRQALARYRILSPFFASWINAVTELTAGVTTWSELKGSSRSLGDSVATSSDLTYGMSLGLVLPLGRRLQLTGSYGTLKLKHEPQGKSGSQTVSFNTVRFGAQFRLGR